MFAVRDRLQVVWVPACEDAAAMMEFLALWDWAAQELPAEPVGVAVLCLGDAPVRGGRPCEPPAGAQLRVGRFEDAAVKQAFQLGTAVPGPPPVACPPEARMRLAHKLGRDLAGLGHVGCLSMVSACV